MSMAPTFGNPHEIELARAGAVLARIIECDDCDEKGMTVETCTDCNGTGIGDAHCDSCSCEVKCEECEGKGTHDITCEHPNLTDR